ncbi:MAG: DUF5060 domain-containing protein, partial [Planctomycetota bacterium]
MVRIASIFLLTGLIASSLVASAFAGEDGDRSVMIDGELKEWHKVTLSFAGPFATESDGKKDGDRADAPNPFTDYRMTVRFTHESGEPSYDVPGYFAADGNAGETSAKAGNVWRAHLSPDKPGMWSYSIELLSGTNIAIDPKAPQAFGKPNPDIVAGNFQVTQTDKGDRDLRGEGRLEYVGKHHLQFAGSGRYFLKAGADAPETLLAFADFDDTRTLKQKAGPIKTWKPHV